MARQLCVISGKGGTGKTTVCASLAALTPGRAVLADCDVDAANLHLALGATLERRRPFSAGFLVEIDQDQCIQCGACLDTCRFEGIAVKGGIYQVDPMRCEGCLACTLTCPQQAIQPHGADTGEILVSVTGYGTLVHARLAPGRENSGKLVMAVREEAARLAKQEDAEIILIDGAPGIGCPVIATLSGADLALLVTEPTPSGRQGLGRALKVAAHFGVPAVACINRADLSAERVAEIERLLDDFEVPLLARIPFDRAIVEATASLRPAVEVADGAVKESLLQLAGDVFAHLMAESVRECTARRPSCDETCRQ